MSSVKKLLWRLGLEIFVEKMENEERTEGNQLKVDNLKAQGSQWIAEDPPITSPKSREKRLLTPGSSIKKMAAPSKRLREDEEMNIDEEELNIVSLLASDDEVEDAAGEGLESEAFGRRAVDLGVLETKEWSYAKVAAGSEGARKRRWEKVTDKGKFKKPRQRSNHLVVLKGEKFRNITMQEHRELIGNIDDQIFSGKYEREPKIDWTSWKERSMVGCEDEYTVSWLKGIVPKLMLGCTAWEKDETPFETKLVTTIAMPTGGRPAEDIMKRVVVGNDLKGEFGILGVTRKESSVTILVGVDGTLAEGLEARGLQAHCGVMKITFERPGGFAFGGRSECFRCGEEGHVWRHCKMKDDW